MTFNQVSGRLSPWVQRQRLAKVSSRLRGPRILDFGCGSGELFAWIPRGSVYLGVDPSEEAVTVARASHPRAQFVHMKSAVDLQSTGSFDSIAMAAVLEHLSDPEGTLRALATLLADGGRVVATTPHPSAQRVLSLGATLGLLSRAAQDEHETLLSRSVLERLAESAGLRLAEYGRFLAGLNQVIVFTKPPRARAASAG